MQRCSETLARRRTKQPRRRTRQHSRRWPIESMRPARPATSISGRRCSRRATRSKRARHTYQRSRCCNGESNQPPPRLRRSAVASAKAEDSPLLTGLDGESEDSPLPACLDYVRPALLGRDWRLFHGHWRCFSGRRFRDIIAIVSVARRPVRLGIPVLVFRAHPFIALHASPTVQAASHARLLHLSEEPCPSLTSGTRTPSFTALTSRSIRTAMVTVSATSRV